MSFAPRQKSESATAEKDPKQCAAYGCKCRASVKLSGGWTCFAHAYADPEDWQRVTTLVREHSWLGEFIDEIRTMEAKAQNWRGFAMQFWESSDKFCQPEPRENVVPYENRMRSEFLYRIGQLPKRPQPRIPETSTPRRGGAFANMRTPVRGQRAHAGGQVGAA